MHAYTNDQIDNKENKRWERKRNSAKSGQNHEEKKKNEKENVQKMKDKNV